MVLHTPSVTASLAEPHAFMASTSFHVGSDGRRFNLCAICGGVKRWACHHGGSTMHRPRYPSEEARVKARPPAQLVPARQERPQPPVPDPVAPPARPWQLYALEAALEAAASKADDVGYVTAQHIHDCLRAIRSELHPTTVRHRPVLVTDLAEATPPPPPAAGGGVAFPPRTPAPTGAGGEGRRRILAGIRSDQLRKIAVRAFEQGWQSKVLGNGHLRFMGPEGGHFTLSMTGKDTARSFPNVKAAAKRAGLDTSAL